MHDLDLPEINIWKDLAEVQRSTKDLHCDQNTAACHEDGCAHQKHKRRPLIDKLDMLCKNKHRVRPMNACSVMDFVTYRWNDIRND